MKNSTIVALATPVGCGAISIVKLSGPNSLDVARSLFVGPNYDDIKPRHMYFGRFLLDCFSEQCLMVWFKSPHSYTGEDVVEFQCHGSEYLIGKIVDACTRVGAVLAQPGEFTKRAFLNGKVSLDEAEGIIDVISSESDAELKAVSALTDGKLFKTISDMQKVVVDLVAQFEVAMDYPDEDVEVVSMQNCKTQITELAAKLDAAIANNKSGAVIKSGINVALVGRPNAGKSSLLNSLLGQDRAIVTDIAGTTRDVIRETILCDGIKINFIDTAGLRDAENLVEKIGIERSRKEIEKADIVLYLIDLEKEIDACELQEIANLKNDNLIIVGNKIDKKHKNNDFFKVFSRFSCDLVEISALSGKNVENLKRKIIEKCNASNIDYSQIILTNKRHQNLAKNCWDICQNILSLSSNTTADIFCFELRKLWNELGKITGNCENEDIINTIFSKFCLGK